MGIRSDLVEHITAAKYEGGAIILRGADATDVETVQLLADGLLAQAQHAGTLAPLIICLDDGQSLEALTEDEMRAAGWVRADKALGEGDAVS